MNTLSWLLYLADVSDDLDFLMMAATFASVLAACLSLWVRVAESDPADKAGAARVLKVAFPMALAFWILSAVIPAKETVYAIAASELGETAINSPTGGKAVKALNAWLDRQISGDQPTAPTSDGNAQ